MIDLGVQVGKSMQQHPLCGIYDGLVITWLCHNVSSIKLIGDAKALCGMDFAPCISRGYDGSVVLEIMLN